MGIGEDTGPGIVNEGSRSVSPDDIERTGNRRDRTPRPADVSGDP